MSHFCVDYPLIMVVCQEGHKCTKVSKAMDARRHALTRNNVKKGSGGWDSTWMAESAPRPWRADWKRQPEDDFQGEVFSRPATKRAESVAFLPQTSKKRDTRTVPVSHCVSPVSHYSTSRASPHSLSRL